MTIYVALAYSVLGGHLYENYVKYSTDFQYSKNFPIKNLLCCCFSSLHVLVIMPTKKKSIYDKFCWLSLFLLIVIMPKSLSRGDIYVQTRWQTCYDIYLLYRIFHNNFDVLQRFFPNVFFSATTVESFDS